MSGRKKKLSAKLKRYNVVLIVSLVVLMALLGTLMVYKMVGSKAYYKIESRDENIAKSKSNDSKDHETIGWIRVQGTNIDYPVYGVIQDSYEYPVTDSFLWSLNMDKEFHDMLLVYGHNVMNLGPNPTKHSDKFTRMEELMNFVYYDFAQENQYIQITINGKDYLYKIFAVNFMKVSELNEYPEGDWEKQIKKEYLERIKAESIYDYKVDADENDDILSVVTCSSFFTDGVNYDFIVTGRRVAEGEAIEKTSVHRNKNYVQIDEIMKEAREDVESVDNA